MTDKICVDGAEIGYIKFGGGKTPLVILPGLSVQSVLPAAEAIERQYEIFKKDFTIWLFDRRGNLPEHYPISEMAEDTAKAMQALGIKNACVFGASQGGMMAMTVAAEHPELVGRLAVGSTACRNDEGGNAVIKKWAELARNGEAEKLYLSFGKMLYSADFFKKYRQAFIENSKSVTAEELERFTILAGGMEGFDIRKKLKTLTCPVLVLSDTQDRIFSQDTTAELCECLKTNPKFEAYAYSGYGHASYDTAPDYQQRLYNFFTK